MSASLASPRGKALAWKAGSIAVICGLPVLLLLLCVSYVGQTFDARDLAARQAATLSQIVAKLSTRHERGLTPEDIDTLYLQSKTATLARAEIQSRATKLVETAGGRLAEAQLTSTPEQEGDGTVAVQLALDIDNHGLFDLLYSTESGLPLLTVTNLTTQAGKGRVEEQASGRLHVEMTMQGQFRKAAE